MIKSMTGFGRGSSSRDGKEFLVEIKTVNHKYSDVFIKMPRQISFLEEKTREAVSKSISRGKIDIFISFEDFSGDSRQVVFDEALAKAYLDAARALKDKYSLIDDISAGLISRFPDVLKVIKTEDDEDTIWCLLKEALAEALENLLRMRQEEGERLKLSILDKTNIIHDFIHEIENRSQTVTSDYKSRLESRIKELLGQQTIDDNRIAMEIAIFADRCSIDEELVRLKSHVTQLVDTLKINQPVGRKLDFLIQEMNREINTIGSKSNDLTITKNVVELKSEIEKIREQIQNIE